MTTLSTIITAPDLSYTKQVETAEQFFKELDPTGELQALRTRRQLIYDFATLCLLEMGKIYQRYYNEAYNKSIDLKKKMELQSCKCKMSSYVVDRTYDNDDINAQRDDTANKKAIHDHFENTVKPRLEARRNSMKKIYGEIAMKGLLSRLNSPDNELVIIPKIMGSLSKTINVENEPYYDEQIAHLVFPLVHIILKSDNANLPFKSGQPSNIGLCFCLDKTGNQVIGVATPSLIYTYTDTNFNEVNETLYLNGETLFLLLPLNPGGSIESPQHTMDTFIATMQLALCVERRLALKDLTCKILNEFTQTTCWNDLVNIIMDHVPPPKSAIEIVEE